MQKYNFDPIFFYRFTDMKSLHLCITFQKKSTVVFQIFHLIRVNKNICIRILDDAASRDGLGRRDIGIFLRWAVTCS